MPNNQRLHRTSHAPKDALPLRMYAITVRHRLLQPRGGPNVQSARLKHGSFYTGSHFIVKVIRRRCGDTLSSLTVDGRIPESLATSVWPISREGGQEEGRGRGKRRGFRRAVGYYGGQYGREVRNAEMRMTPESGRQPVRCEHLKYNARSVRAGLLLSHIMYSFISFRKSSTKSSA